MQEDTYLGNRSDPLSLNLYTYCRNNPLIYWDPTGHAYMTDAQYREYAASNNVSTTGAWKDTVDQKVINSGSSPSSYGDYYSSSGSSSNSSSYGTSGWTNTDYYNYATQQGISTGANSPYVDIIDSLLTQDKGFHSVSNVPIYNEAATLDHSQITGNTSITYTDSNNTKQTAYVNQDFHIGNNGLIVFHDLSIPIAINIANGWAYDIAKTNSYSLVPAGPHDNISGLVTVDPIRYARGMGATLAPLSSWGQVIGVRVSYNGVSQDYILDGANPISGRVPVTELDKLFGWKNSWIPNGMTEAVYLGAHGITGFTSLVENTINHTSIIIFATPDSKYYDMMYERDTGEMARLFANEFEGGHVRYATIGAGPSNPGGSPNYLSTLPNRERDVMLDTKTEMTNLGVSDLSTIDSLLTNWKYYKDNYQFSIPYNEFSGYLGQGYNSNSFISALLRSIGIDIKPSVYSPGWSLNPLPETYFMAR